MKTKQTASMDPETHTLHSCHIFLFPFEWTPPRSDSNTLLEKQTDLRPIRAGMAAEPGAWELRTPWTAPASLAQYNEANYFYDFVRPVLYGDPNGRFQLHYRRLQARGSEYVIYPSNGGPYRLEVDDIGLSFYNTGVGVLSIHCYNRSHPDPEDILRINQYGRRLYPPFLGTDPALTGEQRFFEDTDWAAGLDRAQNTELAQALVLEKAGVPWITEDFSRWRQKPRLDGLPGLLEQLLPQRLSARIQFTPVLDDRMFVLCWYGNDDLANSTETRRYAHASPDRDWWYKFIFVDTATKTCQDERMTRRLLRDHTNLRWGNYGTLYGVSRYSFVCLTPTLPALLRNNAAFVVSHVQTVYFKLAELALVQRACVLRFSDEVTAIGNLEPGDRRLSARAASLSKQFIRFINKIYFREVTAQEQGIELYDLLQTHMRNESQVKDLDREIQELHQYVSAQEEDRRNEKLDLLTYIGAFFVVPSFVCTYLSINDFDFKANYPSVAALCVLAALSFFGIVRMRGALRWLCVLAAAGLVLYTLFAYPEGRIAINTN